MFEDFSLDAQSGTLIDAPFETKSYGAAPARAPASPRSLSTRRRPRKTLSDRVREAIVMLSKAEAEVLSHEETNWASITFTGTRHEITLEFAGKRSVEVGEEFIADLPDHEFYIPGQLVADANVREVDHRFGAEERMIVTCVLLLLEDV